MTFESALNRIQTKFSEIDGSKLADMAVQVTLTDEDCGGTLYFKVTDGVIDVQGYDYRDNDAIIDIDRKALMDILAGKSTLDKAIESGLATANGDFEKLNTLKAAIPTYDKKSVEKKTTIEKTETTDTKKKTTAKAKTTVKKASAAKTETAATAKKAAPKADAKKTTAKNQLQKKA